MPRSPEVHKFGGASLANAKAIAHAVEIVLAHRRAPIVVVVSALAGVTDDLIAGRQRAVRRRHQEVVRTLFTGPRRKAMLAMVADVFAEAPRDNDDLLARGERLSARIFAAALEAAACPVAYTNAVAVVKTDGVAGLAAPDLARTERAARHVLLPLLRRGVVPVVPGGQLAAGAAVKLQLCAVVCDGTVLSPTSTFRAMTLEGVHGAVGV